MVRKRRMGGEGSIYRRKSDNRWVATMSRGPREARQVRTVYRHSRAEAVEALAELRASHGPLNGRTLTVGAFLERWVRDARDIRDTTRHGYRAAIVTHIAPAIGPVRLADLSPLHVETMLQNLEGRVSPKTARNVHVVLRRALGQALRSGLVTRNVAAREYVDAPRVTSQDPDALSPDEIAALRAVLSGHPLEAHVTVGLGTGLRQGEQLGLAWEDIKDSRLNVRKELARVNGQYQRVEPKTDRSKRTVPLSPSVVEAIARHRERLVAAGFMPTATGPVFVNTKGGPLSGSWLTHVWYDVLELAGVKRRPWKVLRATFASRLHAEGVPERTIADLMGHSRVHTTQRHYISTRDADLTAVVERAVGW
jgi:integrase